MAFSLIDNAADLEAKLEQFRITAGAAMAGGIFILGRIIYALGYYTGDPQKRVPGALISEVLGLLPLIGMSISFGAGLLGWW